MGGACGGDLRGAFVVSALVVVVEVASAEGMGVGDACGGGVEDVCGGGVEDVCGGGVEDACGGGVEGDEVFIEGSRRDAGAWVGGMERSEAREAAVAGEAAAPGGMPCQQQQQQLALTRLAVLSQQQRMPRQHVRERGRGRRGRWLGRSGCLATAAAALLLRDGGGGGDTWGRKQLLSLLQQRLPLLNQTVPGSLLPFPHNTTPLTVPLCHPSHLLPQVRKELLPLLQHSTEMLYIHQRPPDRLLPFPHNTTPLTMPLCHPSHLLPQVREELLSLLQQRLPAARPQGEKGYEDV
ncbi:unnamed protein product [Closterium sp. NIES-64]|nr:unnamed protein product [Closterium sp. NIES-64]